MPNASSDAYDGRCPSCRHTFTLADLRRMAVGDGWQRWILARLPDGSEKLVRFDEFDPFTMNALDIATRSLPNPPHSSSLCSD
jgi:hypothetical protein